MSPALLYFSIVTFLMSHNIIDTHPHTVQDIFQCFKVHRDRTRTNIKHESLTCELQQTVNS